MPRPRPRHARSTNCRATLRWRASCAMRWMPRRVTTAGRTWAGGQPHQQPGLVRLAQLRLSQAQRHDRGDGAVRGAEERTAAVGASEEGGGAAEAGAEEGGRVRTAGRMFVEPFLDMSCVGHA